MSFVKIIRNQNISRKTHQKLRKKTQRKFDFQNRNSTYSLYAMTIRHHRMSQNIFIQQFFTNQIANLQTDGRRHTQIKCLWQLSVLYLLSLWFCSNQIQRSVDCVHLFHICVKLQFYDFCSLWIFHINWWNRFVLNSFRCVILCVMGKSFLFSGSYFRWIRCER